MLIPLYVFPIAGASLGLIIGSFLATLAIRWPQGRSIVNGRSHCDHCEADLAARDLIPIVSFVVSGGKCRYCKNTIKSDHLAIELAAAIIGGLALYISPDLTGLVGALFGWMLIVLAALDAEHHWLPDRLTILLGLSGLLASFVVNEPDVVSRLLGGVAGFCSLWGMAKVYRFFRHREGLGGGDPKMFGAIGCWLGWEALPLVLLGAAFVGLFAAFFMHVRGEDVSPDSALPLGSFMAVSAFPIWLYQTGTGGLIF